MPIAMIAPKGPSPNLVTPFLQIVNRETKPKGWQHFWQHTLLKLMITRDYPCFETSIKAWNFGTCDYL